jgi:hypothetical protein
MNHCRRRAAWGLLIAIAVVAAAVFFLARAFAPPPVDFSFVPTQQAALAALAGAPTITPDSPEERDALARMQALFSDFSPEAIRRLAPDVYAQNLYFNDTVRTITNRDALVDYLAESAEAVASCRVTFHDTVRSGDMYYLRWTMDIQFTSLHDGRTTQSIGVTHLRFDHDGRVTYHQDYWDSTTGIFQHIPILGGGIRTLRTRL